MRTHQNDSTLLDVRHGKVGVRRQPRHCVAAAQRIHAVQRDHASVPTAHRRAACRQGCAIEDILCSGQASYPVTRTRAS